MASQLLRFIMENKMECDHMAKELLDLPADRQRDIAGCLLVSANDKEKAQRAGDAVATMLRDKIDRDVCHNCGENTGLRTDNVTKAERDMRHESTESGE